MSWKDFLRSCAVAGSSVIRGNPAEKRS